MFNLGMPELILIFVVALIVFGPKRLPDLGKSLGRAMNEFKRATNEIKDNLENEVGTAQIKEELLKQQKEIQTSLVAAVSADAAAPAAEAQTTTTKPAEEKKAEPEDKFKSYAG